MWGATKRSSHREPSGLFIWADKHFIALVVLPHVQKYLRAASFKDVIFDYSYMPVQNAKHTHTFIFSDFFFLFLNQASA